MRPLATILLDTPDSAGPVRGVILYRPERGMLYVLDPRTEEPHPEASVPGLSAAIDYAAASWRGEPWDLQWLCEADDLDED